MPAVNVAVIGAGVVGGAFLEQLANLKSKAITYNLIFLSTSDNTLISDDFTPIDTSKSLELLSASTTPSLSIPDLIAFLKKSTLPVILVDNTSNAMIAESYPLFVENNISIATPNKKAFSGSYKLWNDIFSQENGGLVYHEASVGAGLPLISPLKEMVATGDEIVEIEGIFSGTLSYIFNEFSTIQPNNTKFSEIVSVAKKLGYTEPDPRDDLNGLDVARKVTILARISGLPIENSTSFPIHSLIPKELETVQSAAEYMEKLPNFDADMDALKTEAAKENKVLRFIGCIDVPNNKVSVEIGKFDYSHPFASLKGSDNVISIKSKRYTNPLIIQGAGAGAAVTAMGVLGDVIKIAQRIAK
jgi:homoserine dehydrogenase